MCFIGGMPEAVYLFIMQNDFQEIRNIQNRILLTYEHDFSKHAPYDIVPRIRILWNSIPSQLAKRNMKFIYNTVKSRSRAKDYEITLSWLIDCGLVHKISRASKPGIPLKAYQDISAFKLSVNEEVLSSKVFVNDWFKDLNVRFQNRRLVNQFTIICYK